MLTAGRSCAACGGTDWLPLPDPGPASMASDWRVVPRPLEKAACRRCGLVARRGGAPRAALYANGYTLYAHAPGGAFERARQDRYAAWIAEAVARHAPGPPPRVLDVGCGNGSLLLALGAAWPDAQLLGCDPSADAIAHADPRVRAWRGTSDTLGAGMADLVIAVNVIEHTPDPVAFLTDLRRATAPAGTVVVVCPDGRRPGLELLVGDHLHSFATGHLEAFAARAGLMALATRTAPPELGEFQMLVASAVVPGEARITFANPGELNRGRVALLRRWAALDDALAARLPQGAACFGVGEAAGLLRAYAPGAWTRLRACTADRQALDAAPPSFGNVPVVPLDTLAAGTPILVGVRPADQERVRERLAARFASVTTWYDLVEP